MARKAVRKRAGRTAKASKPALTKAEQTNKSIATGAAQARKVLAFRKKQRQARAVALEKHEARPGKAAHMQMVPVRAMNLLGPRASAGVLIAEGDSWFDYPLNDVLEILEDEHGFDVESVAHKGDRVEDMAYSGGQLEEFARRLEKLLRNGKVPRAILLSGGGNDMAGKQFEMLLNHAASPVPGLNEKIVSGVIDDRIRTSYITIVTAITAVCQSYLQRTIPILTHGYDYPVPDGRGFMGGFSVLPGPWLEPGFRGKGYGNQAANTRTMKMLIDRFNDMLQNAVATSGFSHVRYVDLRNTLSNGSNYKKDWANELHPTAKGFRLVADKIAKAV